MAELVWDNLEDRRYETGIDRGVIYPFTGDAVAWNGLTAVTESGSPERKPYYYEGRKVLERVIPGAYAAKIEAITYPDVLDELTGVVSYAPGVRVHDCLAKPFHMTYRTLIGTPGDGVDHGYKIHLVYYILASFDDIAAKTISDTPEPTPFSWTIGGMQKFTDDHYDDETDILILGHQPLDHLSIDSRYVDPDVLQDLEDSLYGTESSAPSIPDPRTLIP